MKDFKELQVWQKSHAVVLKVYRVSRPFPGDERFGLTRQVRKAAASIPANIAEGCGRSTDAELARFAGIASGSASETEYELLLARDLEYIDRKTHAELTNDIIEVRRMLMGLVRYLRRNQKPRSARKSPPNARNLTPDA